MMTSRQKYEQARDESSMLLYGDPVGSMRAKAFNEGSDFGRDYERNKMNEILKVCKGHEDFMWSAKIISIVLECDFRDAKQALSEYEGT